MRLLLDTNVYVYMVSDIESLTPDVRAVLEDVTGHFPPNDARQFRHEVPLLSKTGLSSY